MSETNSNSAATPPAPVIHRDIFTLEKGHLVVQWPDEMTPAEYADIVEWTAIWLRKMKRHAERHAAGNGSGNAAGNAAPRGAAAPRA